jgi:hypothetical protein
LLWHTTEVVAPNVKKALASVTLPKHIDATCPSYGLYSDKRIGATLDSGSFRIALSVKRETMGPLGIRPKNGSSDGRSVVTLFVDQVTFRELIYVCELVPSRLR